jgi:muramoyltetrapeptide carboxypeptidase
MLTLPTLKPGDSVDIIAPASRCSDQQLRQLKELLESWQLKCIIAKEIFGKDLFCANTDEVRLAHLVNALTNTQTKAVICARGGYGSLRLIPALSKLTPPKTSKIFVGMSDITALHLFLQQQWQWSTIHGAAAPDRFSPQSIASLKSLLLGETQQIKFAGSSLNAAAKKNNTINSSITGGNLSIIQASMGTSWQLNGRDKIILLEDTSERGYRVDRMLEHLEQAGIFKNAAAILLGDFTEGLEPDGTSLIKDAIDRFAQSSNLPVVQVAGIGHGYTNFPMPLGTAATLRLGDDVTLTCVRG